MQRQLSAFAAMLDFSLAANSDTPGSVLNALGLNPNKDSQIRLAVFKNLIATAVFSPMMRSN